MNFWRKSKKKTEPDQKKSKADALNGLRQRCVYFQINIQNHILFEPEFETARTINSLLEANDTLSNSDVIKILTLENEIHKVEHYDGSGWYDYQIQLSHFLWLHGFETKIQERKLVKVPTDRA